MKLDEAPLSPAPSLQPPPTEIAPPAPPDDAPLSMIIRPLLPDADDPLATDTSPLAPPPAVHADEPTCTLPLPMLPPAPAPAPAPDTHTTEPPSPVEPAPPLTHTSPPDAPPLSDTSPPADDASDALVLPALKHALPPPLPPLLLPADIEIDPAAPAAELPELSFAEPETWLADSPEEHDVEPVAVSAS